MKDMTRKEFSDRLNMLLDYYEFPAKHGGRQTSLASKLGVAQESARRWLEGEAIPRREKLLQIAGKFPCRIEWLEHGSEPMIDDPMLKRMNQMFLSATQEERVLFLQVLERMMK